MSKKALRIKFIFPLIVVDVLEKNSNENSGETLFIFLQLANLISHLLLSIAMFRWKMHSCNGDVR